FTVFDKRPLVAAGDVVENKRLGAALAAVKEIQDRRDEARLSSPKLSLRDKDRLCGAREAVGLRDPTSYFAKRGAIALPGPVAAYIEAFTAEQRAKQKRRNDVTNQRKRDRELAEA